MKRFLSLGLIFLTCLVLAGCSNNSSRPMLNTDLTRETWMNEIDTNPVAWTRGADNWFLTADPTANTGIPNRNNPKAAPLSYMNVRVPDFSKIKVNGDFHVQIFGTYGDNSVYVSGPNDGVTATVIDVQGDTLCLNQIRKVPRSIGQVVIRIGVNHLSSLIQTGRGRIEGVQVRSSDLTVISQGSGNIYLAGNMNLRTLINVGSGCVSVFGANTPELDIKTNGTGMTNVSGNVGVRSIMHHGRTDINIIGANSNGLKIYADGRGKVGINGVVNLRELKARDFTSVYIFKVSSSDLYAYAYDRARIGLAGFAGNLYLDAFKSSCVGARNMCADTAYVRAHQSAHINIAASNKIFAASTDNSSVYFFGSPNIMSQFVNGNGTVIPIWGSNTTSCPIIRLAPRPVVYRASRQRPTVYRYKEAPTSFKGEKMLGFPYTKHKRKFSGEG